MKRTQRKRGQFGGVFIEAGLAIPFLVVMLLLLTQALRMSRNYVALTLIAREALITASTLDGLDSHLDVSIIAPTNSQMRQCYDAAMVNWQPPAGMKTECARRLLSQRVVGLSKAYDLPTWLLGFKVEIDKKSGGLLSAHVQCTLPGFGRLLGEHTITTTAIGSYDV